MYVCTHESEWGGGETKCMSCAMRESFSASLHLVHIQISKQIFLKMEQTNLLKIRFPCWTTKKTKLCKEGREVGKRRGEIEGVSGLRPSVRSGPTTWMAGRERVLHKYAHRPPGLPPPTESTAVARVNLCHTRVPILWEADITFCIQYLLWWTQTAMNSYWRVNWWSTRLTDGLFDRCVCRTGTHCWGVSPL